MHRLLGRLGSAGASLGALVLLAYCGRDLTLPGEFGPAEIAKIDGDNQTGAAGAPLEDSLVVKVTDQRGQALPEQRVAFTVAPETPGAGVSPEEARTDSEGIARTRWVLGATSGTQSVVARVVGVDGLEVTFEATVGPAGAQRIAAVSGEGQTAPVGTALAAPLVVWVTDQFGNPVADVLVDWDAGDGSVDPSSSSTGADGRAETSWVLGSSTGSQTATASSDGLDGSPVTFTSTAVAGSADELVRVSGNNQSGEPGDELAEPLVVRLVDGQGNGIPDRAVTWVVGAGGGQVEPTTSTTDGNGEARAQWRLGPTTGTNTLNAVVSGVGFVDFRATARSGGGGSSPSRLEFQVQPSDTEEKERFSPAVEVAVLDQDGNLVTDEEIKVKLELTGDDDGKLQGKRDERTRSGVATFDDLKVDKEGNYRLRASADGLPSVDSDPFEVHDD